MEQILDGVIENDRLFGVIYQADRDVDWSSREAVVMANPNLGISNNEEALLLDQAEAVRNPAKQNIFRCKHLNEWMTASTAWMNMSTWSKCYDPELTEESVNDLLCWLGSDLASKLRFERHSEAVPSGYRWQAALLLLNQAIPARRASQLPRESALSGVVEQGHLTATSGSSMDDPQIEADTIADIGRYKVQELAYDARYADQYSQRVSEQTGIPRVEVPPLPALLSPAMKELEAAIYDGRFHHNNHPVLTWCMGNILTKETSVGNYTMPEKERPENKIDAAIALFIAMSRAMLAPSAVSVSNDNFTVFCI